MLLLSNITNLTLKSQVFSTLMSAQLFHSLYITLKNPIFINTPLGVHASDGYTKDTFIEFPPFRNTYACHFSISVFMAIDYKVWQLKKIISC